MRSPKCCIVVIGLYTLREVSRRVEEQIVNMVDQDNEVSPVEEVAMGDQVSDLPLPMTERDRRAAFLNLT